MGADEHGGSVIAGLAVISTTDQAELHVFGQPDALVFPVRRATKKLAIRFSVGVPGFRGTVWRLWANRDLDDVYLASRQTAGEMKISLHQSGDWRAQIVHPGAPKTVHFAGRGESGSRILSSWERPSANGVGWTHALTIVLPGDQLSDIPGDAVQANDVRWLPTPSSSERVDILVYLVRPDQGVLGLPLDHHVLISVVDALELAGGEVVVVVAFKGPMDHEQAELLSRLPEDFQNSDPPAEWDRSPELGPRTLVYGDDEEGRPEFYDLILRASSD